MLYSRSGTCCHQYCVTNTADIDIKNWYVGQSTILPFMCKYNQHIRISVISIIKLGNVGVVRFITCHLPTQLHEYAIFVLVNDSEQNLSFVTKDLPLL